MTRDEILMKAFADVVKKRLATGSTQLVKAVGDVMSERLGQMQAARVLPAPISPAITNEVYTPKVDVIAEASPPTVTVYNEVESPNIVNEIAVPSVVIDLAGVAEVIRQLMTKPDLVIPPSAVTVDMKPLAQALEKLADAVLKQGQLNAAMATEQAALMKQLIHALATKPAIEFKPVINVPKVEVPPINVEPIAKAISAMPKQAERPKRTFTIKHEDKSESVVTEE